jgi:serine/threonine-protein kinase
MAQQRWMVLGEGDMQITLTVTAGPHKGRVFTFGGHDTFLVGRSKRVHFRLQRDDRYFSRVHFLVEVNPPQCRLVDLASRNGTYVNGERVETADLRDGDQIKAGRTILRVSVESDEPPPAPPRPAAVSSPNTEAYPAPTVGATLPPQAGTEMASRLPSSAPAAEQSSGHLPAVAPVPSPATRPPTPLPASAGIEVCRVCGGPVAESATGALGPAVPGPWLLCQICTESIRFHPQPVPGYWIVRELGRGGMGTVYLALEVSSGAVVALKTIKPAVEARKVHVDRFLREADILRGLDHPHIVRFRGLGEVNGSFYFTMDHVSGTDAKRLLKKEGPLAPERAVALVCEVLEALEYAHNLGFVHRDIKPANLLITPTATGEEARLADFGLARVYQASHLSGLTMSGEWGGTVGFMSPEQVTNFRQVRPAADQYSTSATLYNLLTNKHIYDFPARIDQQLAMILNESPVPIASRRPDLPRPVMGAIHKALSRDPERRFPDVGAMRQALLPFTGAGQGRLQQP